MATKKLIEAGLVARVAGNIKNFASNMSNAWFGPMAPMEPIAVSEEQKASVTGRMFDYPTGVNINVTPRSTEAISFSQLRGLADACDLVRIVIETRKDQMSKLQWVVKPVKEHADPDARCAELTKFFKNPDKEHDWDTWLRMLMEDLFVIDAPCLYIHKTLGGEAYGFDPVDGATIKRIIDERGRTPLPPFPAFQQVMKGMPSANYTIEELIYKPRNVRTNKIYGYSPVEQIIMTVNIALRRSMHKFQYYSEGNVPEAIVGTPEDWSADQVALFQAHWDTLNEGNTAERRHMKFVPGKLDIVMTKEAVLKDMFDEWLARIVCYAFSVESTPFVAQVNRSVAETIREAALSEGLAPIQKWVTNLMNYIIQTVFGYDDLMFDWADEEVQDPLKRANINKIYLEAKVITVDEVREDLGYKPLSEEQKAELAGPAPPPAMLPGEDGSPPPKAGPPGGPQSPLPEDLDKESGGVTKAKKLKPGLLIDQDRASVVRHRTKLQEVMSKFLKNQSRILATKLFAKMHKVEKGGPGSGPQGGKTEKPSEAKSRTAEKLKSLGSPLFMLADGEAYKNPIPTFGGNTDASTPEAALASELENKSALIDLLIDNEKMPASVEPVKISDLKSIQLSVIRDKVDKLVKEFDEAKPALELPRVFKSPSGDMVLSDGNHRVVAAMMRGDTHINAEVYELKSKINKIEKAGAFDDFDLDWDSLVPKVAVILGQIALDGATSSLKSLGVGKAMPPGPATKWAQDRGAELVGRKWVNGKLVDNPDARWVITDTTREMIQAFTADAIDQGYTMDEFADQLEESFAFSDERAEMIARTETRFADSAGQMQGYVNSGFVEGTEWTTAEDDDVSDECSMNADAGMVPIGESYPSGDLAPPAHPNCRCVIVAVLKPEKDDIEEWAYIDFTKRFYDLFAEAELKQAINKGGPGSGPQGGKHEDGPKGDKPSKSEAKGVKGKLHDVFASGHTFTLSELHAITGGTKESLQSAISNIKNEVKAGKHGKLVLVNNKGVFSLAPESDKPIGGEKPVAAEKPAAEKPGTKAISENDKALAMEAYDKAIVEADAAFKGKFITSAQFHAVKDLQAVKLAAIVNPTPNTLSILESKQADYYALFGHKPAAEKPAAKVIAKAPAQIMTVGDANTEYAETMLDAYVQLANPAGLLTLTPEEAKQTVLDFKNVKALAIAQFSANTKGIDTQPTAQEVFAEDLNFAADIQAGIPLEKALPAWKIATNEAKIAANIKAGGKSAASTEASSSTAFALPESTGGVPVQTVAGSFAPIGADDFKTTGTTAAEAGPFFTGIKELGKVMAANSKKDSSSNKNMVDELLSKELKNSSAYQAINAEFNLGGTLANGFVATWAQSSGDSSPKSVAMQLAIRDTFGMKAEDTNNTALGILGKNTESEIYGLAAKAYGIKIDSAEKLGQFRQAMQEFTKAQYDVTQRFFAKKGITEVSLARGMSVKSSGATEVELSLQPASSFSTHLSTAQSFGATLFLTRVPVAQVLGSFLTGFGCTKEHEVVVLAHSNLKAIKVPSSKVSGAQYSASSDADAVYAGITATTDQTKVSASGET